MNIRLCVIMLTFTVLYCGCSPAREMTRAETGNGTAAVARIEGSTRYGTSLCVTYFGEKDWVVYTDRGYFDCTPGAKKYFHFVKGIEVAGPDEYWDRYYTPGLRELFMKELRHGEERGTGDAP
jgi:hypothetical protein